jgi:PAS domain S-box-containing protein
MTRYGGLSLGLLLLALTIVLLEAGLILLLGITLAKRRRADRALRESESRFRIVADSLPVLIWMSGVDRLRTFFNKPWLDFTGRTAEQEIGNGWADGVHPGNLEGCLKGYVEAFDARRPFVMQYRLRRHDGEYRFISDHGVPRYDTQGGFAGYIGSCVDITDRLRAEAETQQLRQELAHISRLATMGEMTATIAHELSQPLTAIMTNAQAGLRFIGSPDPSRDEVSEIFHDIVVADQRARQVIQNLRAIFQTGDAKRHPLRLNALINDVATVVGTDALLKNVSVTLDLAPQLPLVSGDRVQLQQVVLNLLANAFDAVSDADRPRNVLLRTRTRGTNAVQVDVVDTGPGIAADALASIFEPFVTTKRSGMGMGLSVSRSIVGAHEGKIWAENNAGGGASFHLVLPAISADEAA